MVTYVLIDGNWHEAWFTSLKTMGTINHIAWSKCGMKSYGTRIRKSDRSLGDVCGECQQVEEVICSWTTT